MDDWVKNKLKQWNLEKLENIFEENEITQECFECLNEETIKQLITKVGPQTLFLNKWKSEFVHAKNDTTLQVSLFPCSPHSEPNILLNNPQSDHEIDLIEDEESLRCETETIDTFPYNSKIAIETRERISDLFDIFKKSIQGLAVLNYYSNHRTLNDSYRNLLADVIVTHEMQTNEDLMISPERLSELAILISKTFTSEISATYYIPYSREGNKKALARGKLYLRYNHYRDILLQSGATKNCRGLKRKAIDNSTPVRLGRFEDLFAIDYAPQNCAEKLKFLAEYVDPWNTVEEYWKYTSIKRIQDLISNNQVTSIDYLSTYPALRDIYTGLKLLDIDFKQQYPDKSASLTSQYNVLEKKILAYCEKKKKLSSEIRFYITLLKESKDKDEDVRSAITFRMLPFLLPNPSLLTSRDKSNWRPSKEDVLNGFFLHVKDEEDLNRKLKNRKEKLEKFGLSEQPLSVIIGDSLTNITKRLVIINDIKYQAESTIECVDLTFKSFYSLQLEFSREAAYPWIFLKDVVYKIQGESDLVVPALQTLINDFNSIQIDNN